MAIATFALGGCAGQAPNPFASRDDTTREAQAALVADLPHLTEARVEISVPASDAAILDDTDAPGTYDYRGTPAEAVARARQAELDKEAAAAGWSAQPAAGRRRVVFSNSVSGTQSLIEISSEELADLREAADGMGVNLPSQFAPDTIEAPPGGPELRPQGLSNASDGRVSKAISTTYPIGHTNLRRLGKLSSTIGGCTATLVGRRLVLTAAHCVVPPDLSIPSVPYYARRSGGTKPYGTESSDGFWWDSQYSANNCHITYTTATHAQCAPWDWALLLLRDDAWDGSPNGSPGWMGYGAPSSSQLSVSQYYGDGYALCGLSYSPPGCVSNTAFGQTSAGKGASQQYPDPGDGNFNTYFKTNIDTNPGNSGGPFFRADNILQGIVITEDCGTCSSGTNYPNGVRSMTPWLHGFISSQRAAYP
jgi:hypothetical protein